MKDKFLQTEEVHSWAGAATAKNDRSATDHLSKNFFAKPAYTDPRL